MTVDQADKIIKSRFHEQLKDCMELSALIPTALARKIECPPTTIFNYNHGKYIPNCAMALALSSALGVSMELLLTGEEAWNKQK